MPVVPVVLTVSSFVRTVSRCNHLDTAIVGGWAQWGIGSSLFIFRVETFLRPQPVLVVCRVHASSSEKRAVGAVASDKWWTRGGT